MISLLLHIIHLFVVAFCFLLSILFIVRALSSRKKKMAFAVYCALSTIFIIATCFLWKIDFAGGETTDRSKAIGAFESNFGFKPPSSIKEIKIKNYSMYDASVHWMAFSYDSVIFHRILNHDQPLDTAFRGTQKYSELKISLTESCENCPDWLQLPNIYTDKIFLKKNFLSHSSSEYFLWVNTKERMVYLEVSYFD